MSIVLAVSALIASCLPARRASRIDPICKADYEFETEEKIMQVSRGFLRIASACAMVTALTTLAIHLLPQLWADANTFEKQLQLPHNPIYMARLWIVLIHCLLVLVSMYAVGALRIRENPVLISFGFFGFLVFALTEMLRTSLGIFALNRAWRVGYASATDENTREALRAAIAGFSGINDALFFLFYTAFSLGVLCYGLALFRAGGMDQKMGIVFLLWAILGVPTFVATVTGNQSMSGYFGWVGPYFQPMARALIGIWLWKVSITRSAARSA